MELGTELGNGTFMQVTYSISSARLSGAQQPTAARVTHSAAECRSSFTSTRTHFRQGYDGCSIVAETMKAKTYSTAPRHQLGCVARTKLLNAKHPLSTSRTAMISFSYSNSHLNPPTVAAQVHRRGSFVVCEPLTAVLHLV